MSLSHLSRILCALPLVVPLVHRAPASIPDRREHRADSTDVVATVAIGEEVRAFYRDLAREDWTALVSHFYPAKVTARFAAPEADARWQALGEPPKESRARAPRECAPGTTVLVLGSWARVRARRCSGEVDELWLYAMSNRWKIIHLVFGVRTSPSVASPSVASPSDCR